MNGDKYISPYQLTRQYNISSATLRRWAEHGKIRCIRPGDATATRKKRLYHAGDIARLFGVDETNVQPTTVCYARVSSSHQKEDLERQKALLSAYAPGCDIVSDVASGLNWHRPGLISILDRVYAGHIKTVVVTFKDRLCRFGFELLEWIFEKANAKILVLSQSVDAGDKSNELSEDLLAIVTVFTAQNNGLRAAKYKRARNARIQDPHLSDTESTTDPERVVRSTPLDI